jgi:hypothetical protein
MTKEELEGRREGGAGRETQGRRKQQNRRSWGRRVEGSNKDDLEAEEKR